MLERRWPPEAFKVRLVFEDQIPVGEVARGRQGAGAKPHDLRGEKHNRVNEAHEDNDGQRGEQSSRPPQPERAKANAALPFAFQQEQ